MQILDDDDPGAVRTQDFHEIAELPQHPLPRGAENLVAENDAIVVIEKGRHLRQPGRGMGAQRLEDKRPIFAAAAFLQRLDERQEGLIPAEKLGAAPPQHAGAKARQAFLRHFDQRRLADSGLSGDENHLPIAAQNPLHQKVQRLERSFAADPPVGARRGNRNRGAGGRREAITASGHRDDEGRWSAGATQRLAQGEDGLADIAFFHDPARPDRTQNFVLADDAVGILDQVQQRVEHFRRERDRSAAARQNAPARIQSERTETV